RGAEEGCAAALRGKLASTSGRRTAPAPAMVTRSARHAITSIRENPCILTIADLRDAPGGGACRVGFPTGRSAGAAPGPGKREPGDVQGGQCTEREERAEGQRGTPQVAGQCTGPQHGQHAWGARPAATAPDERHTAEAARDRSHEQHRGNALPAEEGPDHG